MDQRKLKSSSFLLIGLIVLCLNLIMPAQGLSIEATNGTVASNEISGTLTCTIQDVDDLHQNYTVEWFKNDISLKGVDGFTIEQKGLVSNLTVKVIDENKVGVYLCRAVDPVTSSSDTGHPHLEAWPRVKIQLDHGEKSLTRIAGEDIEITCTVYSHPAPLSIIWLREDGSVAASQNMTKDFNNTERANGMLYMSNLNMTDRGEYSCVASNEIMGRYRVSSNETVLLRIKDPLAPLWPFIGIMAEIVVLAVIIAAYEINKRRKQKKRENLDSTEKRLIPNASGTNNADDGGDVRKRK